MKTLFLCTISLLLSSSASPVGFATYSPNIQNEQQQPVMSATFDAGTLVKLLEEYTLFTRTEPQNTSEELVIAQLIDGLSAQSSRLEEEIQNNKSSAQKTVDHKLRQYYGSVRTALKELHKRQQRVRVLAQNLVKGEHGITHIALREPHQNDMRLFSTSQRLRDSFLQTPLASSC